jgi:hypothetical protein
MNSLELILTGIGLTFIAYNTFYIWIDKGYLPNVKPFNCQFCISFWVFVLIFLLSFNPVTAIVPIAYKLINKL